MNNFEENSLPSNITAERVVIASVLIDNRYFDQASERLDVEDFCLDSHRCIWRRIIDLFAKKKYIDEITLAAELRIHKELDSVGGASYISSLSEDMPRRPAIADYVADIKDKSLLRSLMAISNRSLSRASDQSEDAQSILESVTDQLQRISEQGVSSPLQTFGSFVQQTYPSIDAVFQHSARSLGLPSGIKTLDELTCGFQRKELIVVAARPGAGKTALGLCLAAHASLDLDQTSAFFSLEMRKAVLLHRLVAQRSTLSLQDIREGKWSSTTQRYALEALSEIAASPFYIDDHKGMTVQKMKSKAARLKAHTGHLDLIVIDQLNHIIPPAGSEKYGQRRIDMGFITRGLAAMASELDVPVIVLHQLSRENEKRDDKRPRLSDLRESGSVEEDADMVLFPHRPSYYDPKADEDEKLKAEIIVAKNRNGPTGTAICEYVAERTFFRNKEEKVTLWT